MQIVNTLAVLAFVVCSQALAQSTQSADPPKTGTFETKFTERSPLSTPEQLAKRLGLAKPAADYDPSAFDVIVHVPTNYDAAKPVGVMYMLLYKDTGEPPHPCLPFFDESGMIFVVPKKRDPPEHLRCGLMLDVLHHLKSNYRIDESRMYLFAMYGGDMVNQRIALASGDQFTGLFLSEAQFYRELPSKDGRKWPERFKAPPPAYMAPAKRRGIILDHKNASDQYAPYVHKGFESDGFKYVLTTNAGPEDLHYPTCSPDFLKKTFDFFEASRVKAAAGASQTQAPATRPATTQPAATSPNRPSVPEASEPARMLKLAALLKQIEGK